GQCPADLCAQLDLLNGGKLTEEAQPRLDVVYEWSTHQDLWNGGWSNGGVALMILIRQAYRNDDGESYPQSAPQFGQRPSRGARAFFSDARLVVGFAHVPALLGSMCAVRRKSFFRHRVAALHRLRATVALPGPTASSALRRAGWLLALT